MLRIYCKSYGQGIVNTADERKNLLTISFVLYCKNYGHFIVNITDMFKFEQVMLENSI
tara:strand:- start:3391 stop:3564 length:174 start_codon:yes stop_codon:yes gene_type:complete